MHNTLCVYASVTNMCGLYVKQWWLTDNEAEMKIP